MTRRTAEYTHWFADGYDLAWWVTGSSEQSGLIGTSLQPRAPRVSRTPRPVCRNAPSSLPSPGAREPGVPCQISRGIVPCGAFGNTVTWPVRRAAEPGEGPVFRFVLVSVLRGQCPWLSV